MQESIKCLAQANKLFKTADHLTYMTYPLVKDERLIITIMENLAEAMAIGMNALLERESALGKIKKVPIEFKDRFEIFKNECAKRYNFNLGHLELLKDLNVLQDLRKNSSFEFSRNGYYVLAEKDFRTRKLTYQMIKNDLNLSKGFFEKINSIMKNVN